MHCTSQQSHRSSVVCSVPLQSSATCWGALPLKYHRVERAYGSFMRRFRLPEDAEGTKVTAEYKDCILRVRLPKADNAKAKAIEVKVS